MSAQSGEALPPGLWLTPWWRRGGSCRSLIYKVRIPFTLAPPSRLKHLPTLSSFGSRISAGMWGRVVKYGNDVFLKWLLRGINLYFRAVLVNLDCAQKSPGDLITMQILMP